MEGMRCSTASTTRGCAARGQLGTPAEHVAEVRETTVAYRSLAGVMLVPFLVALAEIEMRAGYVNETGATLVDALGVATERAEPLPEEA